MEWINLALYRKIHCTKDYRTEVMITNICCNKGKGGGEKEKDATKFGLCNH